MVQNGALMIHPRQIDTDVLNLIGFDIAGTLEIGGPLGVLTRFDILHQREIGHIISNASD